MLSEADKFPEHLQSLLFSMMNPKIRWNPEKLEFNDRVTTREINRVVEDKILQCDRSAYFGQSSEIGPYYEYLKRNYPAKNWYRGAKNIFEGQAGFALHVGRESRMVRYFKLFLESGIYSQISKLVWLNATILRDREVKLAKDKKFRHSASSFKVVRLGGSIQTIFILDCICLAACICLGVLEYVKYNKLRIVKSIRSVWTRCKQVIQFKRDRKLPRRIKKLRGINPGIGQEISDHPRKSSVRRSCYVECDRRSRKDVDKGQGCVFERKLKSIST